MNVVALAFEVPLFAARLTRWVVRRALKALGPQASVG